MSVTQKFDREERNRRVSVRTFFNTFAAVALLGIGSCGGGDAASPRETASSQEASALSETVTPETVTPETSIPETSLPEAGGESTTADKTTEADADVSYNPTPLGDPTGTDELPASAPDSFWAITTVTYELVEVDSRTGDILGRYGSWGSGFGDCEGDDGCLFQGLQDVQVAANGTLWLSDCCEPAAGNIYSVRPGDNFSPDGSFVTLGDAPLLSPDGSTIAFTGLGSLILSDADGGSRTVVAERGDDGPYVWYQPLEWIDDSTLLVRSSGDLVDNLVVLDVSDPANPQEISQRMGGLISHTDAAVRADGMVFALTRLYGGEFGNDSNLSAWVFDPQSGDAIAQVDLPDDIDGIDYDSTGTFLITTGQSGVVRFFGAGRSGVLAEGFLAASW